MVDGLHKEENDRLRAENRNLKEELMEHQRISDRAMRKMKEEKEEIRTVSAARIGLLIDEVLEMHDQLEVKELQLLKMVAKTERMTEEVEEGKAELQALGELYEEEKEHSMWLFRRNEELREKLLELEEKKVEPESVEEKVEEEEEGVKKEEEEKKKMKKRRRRRRRITLQEIIEKNLQELAKLKQKKVEQKLRFEKETGR